MPSFYDVNMDCNSLPAGQSGQPYSSQNSSPEFDPERDDRLSEASNSTIIIRVEEADSHEDEHRLPPLDLFGHNTDDWSSSPSTGSLLSALVTPPYLPYWQPSSPTSPYTAYLMEGNTLQDPRHSSIYTHSGSRAEATVRYSESQSSYFDVSKSELLAPAPVIPGNISPSHTSNYISNNPNYLSIYRESSPSGSSSASFSPVLSDCELDSSSNYVYVQEEGSQAPFEMLPLQTWTISDVDDSPNPPPSSGAHYFPSPYLPEAPLSSHNDQFFVGLTSPIDEQIDNNYFDYLSSISKPVDFTGSYPNVAPERVDSYHAGSSISEINQSQTIEPNSAHSDQFALFLLDNPPEPPSDLSPWIKLGPRPPPDYYIAGTNPSDQHWYEVTLNNNFHAVFPHDHVSSNQLQSGNGFSHSHHLARPDQEHVQAVNQPDDQPSCNPYDISSLGHALPSNWTVPPHSRPCEIYHHHTSSCTVHGKPYSTPLPEPPSGSTKQRHRPSLSTGSDGLLSTVSSSRQLPQNVHFDDAGTNDPSPTSAMSESPPRLNGRGISSGGGPLRGSKRDPHHDSKLIVHRVLVDSRTRGEADRRVKELAEGSQNAHCLKEFEAASDRRPRVSQRGLEKSNNRRKTERRFSCILCTATVTTNDNLQNHYRSHLIFNEFACEWCKRYFRTTSILNRHQNEAQQCLVLHSMDQEPRRTKRNPRS